MSQMKLSNNNPLCIPAAKVAARLHHNQAAMPPAAILNLTLYGQPVGCNSQAILQIFDFVIFGVLHLATLRQLALA
jgi:hypothetical protein